MNQTAFPTSPKRRSRPNIRSPEWADLQAGLAPFGIPSEALPLPHWKGLNQSILGFQTRTESGTYPNSVHPLN